MREALEGLKDHLGAQVHVRMTDLVKPVQKKYRKAVAVALGINIDAIVVDDGRTAIGVLRCVGDVVWRVCCVGMLCWCVALVCCVGVLC